VTEVGAVVEAADVFLVAFGNISERLLVDTHADAETSPMIDVVEQVSSYQERIFWLGKNRPTLGMPEGFSFLNWPHSVGFLVESGLWAKVRQRVGADSNPDLDAVCNTALDRLQSLERTVLRDAIVGHRYV